MSAPKILRVTPIDFNELIIEFENSEYRIFSPRDSKLYDEYSFLAYPNKLKSFIVSPDKITWFNDISFDKEFLYRHSSQINFQDLSTKSLTVGFKNLAPTESHKTHHVYSVSIRPFSIDKTFELAESIGGGHAEMGGSMSLSVDELLKRNDWKTHFEKSDCSWAIKLIEEYHQNLLCLINHVVTGICKRSKPD